MVVEHQEIRINMFLMKWKLEKWAKKNIVSFGKINSNWYNFPFVLPTYNIYIQIFKKIIKNILHF